MKRLWAGWRMMYVESAGKTRGCLFCSLARRSPDPGNLILRKTGRTLIVLNAFPYNCGHLMVAPVRHCGTLGSLGAADRAAVWEDLARSEAALKKVYRPQGLNVGLNLGRTAGAGVTGHVHFHVVPRWNGDSNFMPVIADTKVLPESIDVTYERLAGAFKS